MHARQRPERAPVMPRTPMTPPPILTMVMPVSREEERDEWPG
jgi:hypothetical protein